MENLTDNETDYSIAKERVNLMKKFYASVFIFILVFAVYSFRRYYKTGEITFLDYNGFSVIFWIWGIVLVAKAFKIFFFNHSWERRMIDKELNKEQHGKY